MAENPTELAGLMAAFRHGRFYEAEAWVASGGPIQLAADAHPIGRRPASPLAAAIAEGAHAFVLLLLCNGYRLELEEPSPLNAALESRRWDLVDLLIDWGAEPSGADPWRILDTYERSVFERFWKAGVDLARDGAMADALARSTRNRPLYGFVKKAREADLRIQEALDVALGEAIKEPNDKAASLCLWAGADSRRKVRELEDPDDQGMNAIERAVSSAAGKYLKRLGFDPSLDDVQALYRHVHDLTALKLLVEVEPPEDWNAVTERFLQHFAFSQRFSFGLTSLSDLEVVFALGGRLTSLDRYFKRELRQLLLGMGEYEAQRLFRLLRNPENMPLDVFTNLIAHEKLATRYKESPRRYSIDKEVLNALAGARGIPGPLKRWAKDVLAPARQVVTQTELREGENQPRWVSREELYGLVWSEPILSLSKRFGLSDNGLRKRCKAMCVPTPPPGYWQKVKRGHEIKRSPLPSLNGS